MQGKFSKKQIGVLSVVALMAMPASVMASEELQTQQEETVAAHEVETELSDLMESVTEPESVQTESLPEIETQAETLESEAEESQAEQLQVEQSEVTKAVSEENLSEELESEAEPELQLETEPLNSNAEDNEARSADNCWWVNRKVDDGSMWITMYMYIIKCLRQMETIMDLIMMATCIRIVDSEISIIENTGRRQMGPCMYQNGIRIAMVIGIIMMKLLAK